MRNPITHTAWLGTCKGWELHGKCQAKRQSLLVCYEKPKTRTAWLGTCECWDLHGKTRDSCPVVSLPKEEVRANGGYNYDPVSGQTIKSSRMGRDSVYKANDVLCGSAIQIAELCGAPASARRSGKGALGCVAGRECVSHRAVGRGLYAPYRENMGLS